MGIGYYLPLLLLLVNVTLALILRSSRPVVFFQVWNILSGLLVFFAGLGNDFFLDGVAADGLGMGGNVEVIIGMFALQVIGGMFIAGVLGLYLHKAARKLVILFMGIILFFPFYFFFLHKYL